MRRVILEIALEGSSISIKNGSFSFSRTTCVISLELCFIWVDQRTFIFGESHLKISNKTSCIGIFINPFSMQSIIQKISGKPGTIKKQIFPVPIHFSVFELDTKT